jgi:general secretion pathway protein F/type IV pilus assembly protein PilC
MPEYKYIARELSGRQVTGVLTAPSERDAVGALSAQRLFPVDLAPAESAQARQTRQAKRVPAGKLAVFYSQLADLLRAGVPLLKALDLLHKQTTHAGLKRIIVEVRDQVADGSRLAEALRKHPVVFNDLTVSIVRAGEEGSFLEDSLQRIATFTEHQEELKSKALGAMIYPVILMVFGAIVVTGMLVFFVPRFEPLFEGLRERNELPWVTTALLALSGGLQNHGWLVLAALIGLSVAARQWSANEIGRKELDRWRLKVPGLGGITLSLAISRFCRVLGTLLHNGVPMLSALRISKDATGNAVLSDAVAAAAERISSGKSLARPLAESGYFPVDVIEMISVGEEANNLEQVLIQIAEKMERYTQRRLDLAVRLLEPLLLVVMGLLILFVFVGLLLPIFKSSSII